MNASRINHNSSLVCENLLLSVELIGNFFQLLQSLLDAKEVVTFNHLLPVTL